VDVRQFVRQAGEGDWEGAFKALARTMPVPRILGRICDHPCEHACLRGEAGEPIAIAALERTCVETARQAVRMPPLPRKEPRIAIVGSGLASLTVAWDLLRKGYDVTLFEPSGRIGNGLWSYPDTVLPAAIIAAELQFLGQQGAVINLGAKVGRPRFITGLRQEFGAVFVGLDTYGVNFGELDEDEQGLPEVTPLTQATGMAGVFAGGAPKGKGRPSPVNEVLDGRRAATSIDRYVSRVSMTSGREREGAFDSELYTNIDGLAPLPRVQPAERQRGYTPEEARLEAGRCIQCQCLECVKVCAYLEKFKGYPKKYAREIYNNERMVPGGVHRANLLVNSCSNCGLCETVCPNDFHMGELCLDARRSMVARGKMPPVAHEFALQDMEFSSGDTFALARHEPGMTSSRYLFFPSCQLAGSSPGAVSRAYGYLRGQVEGGVGLMLGCCGAPAYWAGRDDLFYGAIDALRAGWHALGEPAMIVACSSCSAILREQLPEIPLVLLWELLEQTGLPEKACSGGEVVVVDPCSSRLEPAVQGSVRRLLEGIGVTVEELLLHGDKPECCGFGGLMANANPPLAQEVVARRVGLSGKDYVAYCAMCRDRFAANGQRTTHLLELLFPGGLPDDPASRPATGWSLRHENRARLKESLLREIWGEGSGAVAAADAISLTISPEVLARMDAQRILLADLQRVIEHGERSGKRLYNRESGLYRAYLRPHRVTFWVDYLPHGDGFTVLNAYCHRMEIVRSSHD
jgi:NADPH-dependent glutamate synthase beta subunit-like oxidoreductase